MPEKLIHPALLKLFRLNMRAKFRRMRRGMRTVKGIIFTCFTAGFLLLWIAPTVVMGFLSEPTDPDKIRSFAPMGLMLFCFFNLLGLKADKGIAFLPAEVDFLFCGPYRRRDLLAYKILAAANGSLGVALFASLFLIQHTTIWLAGFVGVFLSLLFLQLLGMNLTLIASTVAERAFSLLRKIVLFAITLTLAAGLAVALSSAVEMDAMTVFTQFRESWFGTILLAPFEVFGRTIAAETFYPELLGWGSAGLAINVVMILLVLQFDANFLEASLASSKKRHDILQRARRGAGINAARKVRVGWKIPQLPWLGGAGPIAWRQLMTALRGVGGILFIFLIFGGAMSVPLLMNKKLSGDLAFPLLFPPLMMMVFMFPQMIRFDFRGDIDRMETLKTLPINSTAIVVGQLIAPVLAATFIQVLYVSIIAFLVKSISSVLFLVIIFTIPVNVLIFGLENFIFLLYPTRQVPGSIEIHKFGSQMLLVLLKMLMMALVAGCAAGVGGIAYLIAGESIIAFAVGCLITACVLAMACIPAVAWAYRRFDPSVDTPA